MTRPLQAAIESTRARVQQAWDGIILHFPDIQRIAAKGPDGSDHDSDIVRMVFSAVAGKILFDDAMEGDR